MASSKVTIISYGLISISHGFKNARVSELIAKSKFGVVIVDESHYLKSMKAIRTKEILNSLKGIAHIIMLSGTPSLSRPEEVIVILVFLKVSSKQILILIFQFLCNPLVVSATSPPTTNYIY